jgi:predicted nucleic acid-binding Zn ribbon protein
MEDILPDHDHCLICDDPIDKGQKFCSDLCKEEYEKDENMRKWRDRVFIIAIVVLLVSFSLASYFYG